MMKKIRITVLSEVLCLMLVAAMAFTIIGCGQTTTTTAEVSTAESAEASDEDAKTAEFTFTVVYADGTEEEFIIDTTAETVGEALLAEGLIEGESSEYGLYVKTVNGVTADYDVDGTYWAFYVNGEYASTGVDSTPVEDGASYMFKVE